MRLRMNMGRRRRRSVFRMRTVMMMRDASISPICGMCFTAPVPVTVDRGTAMDGRTIDRVRNLIDRIWVAVDLDGRMHWIGFIDWNGNATRKQHTGHDASDYAFHDNPWIPEHRWMNSYYMINVTTTRGPLYQRYAM